MKRNKNATCATCFYWQHLGVDEGSCRRTSPVIDLIKDESPPNIGKVSLSKFPHTLHDWWCGEHPDFISPPTEIQKEGDDHKNKELDLTIKTLEALRNIFGDRAGHTNIDSSPSDMKD